MASYLKSAHTHARASAHGQPLNPPAVYPPAALNLSAVPFAHAARGGSVERGREGGVGAHTAGGAPADRGGVGSGEREGGGGRAREAQTEESHGS